MHGSINWEYYNNKSLRLTKYSPYYIKRRRDEKIAVLAPGWVKDIDVGVYRKIWKEARNVLQKAKSIFIIGYSLPETDILAHALFAEIVRHRKQHRSMLNQIVLVDKSNLVRNKFKEIFLPIMSTSCPVHEFDSYGDFISDIENKNTSNILL